MANFVLNAVAREEAVQRKGLSRCLRLQKKSTSRSSTVVQAEPVAVYFRTSRTC